jgi:hypothetical protein
MAISSEGNRLFVHGELSREDSLRLLAAMHNTVASRGYTDFELNFASCLRAFSPEMLAICAQCLSYWKDGIDISLVLPNDQMMKRLFLNTGWAHLIDHRTYDPSAQRRSEDSPFRRSGIAGTEEAWRAPSGRDESSVCSCALVCNIRVP